MRFLLILLAFAVMGWGYWALSGGSDFQPRSQAAAVQAAAPAAAPVPSAAPEPGPELKPELGPEPGSGRGTLLDDVTAVASTAAEAEPVAEAEPAPRDVAVELALAPSDPADGLPDDSAEPIAEEPILAADALALLAPEAPAEAQPEDGPEEITVAAASSAASAEVGPVLRRVTANRVNVRQGPGTEHGVLTQVSAGDVAEVLGQDGGWVQVRAPDGSVGWMSGRFLGEAGG